MYLINFIAVWNKEWNISFSNRSSYVSETNKIVNILLLMMCHSGIYELLLIKNHTTHVKQKELFA